MHTAHELAKYAAAAADYICMDEIVAFSIEDDLLGQCVRVSFRFDNGTVKRYTVAVEKEADAPNGESGPSSP